MSTDGHNSAATSDEAASLGLDAEQLRTRRLAIGLSRRALAPLLGCSIHAIQAWEQGKRSVPQDIEPALARAEKAAWAEIKASRDRFAELLARAEKAANINRGAELRALRQYHDFSREELAAVLNYSPRTVEALEQDRRKISWYRAAEIRRAFESVAADLAELEDDED